MLRRLGVGDDLAVQIGRYLQAQGARDTELLIDWLKARLQPGREGATRLLQDGDDPGRVAERLVELYGHAPWQVCRGWGWVCTRLATTTATT